MYNNRPVIPVEEYKSRWEKVKEMMENKNLDIVIAYADDRATFGAAHSRWLADFPVHFEPVCIMFPGKSDPIMLVGPETEGYAKMKSRIKNIRVLKEFTHPDEDYPFSKIESLSEIISETLCIDDVRRVGIAAKELMGANMYENLVKALPKAEWIDVEHDMCMLRAVKTSAEIEVIKYAYKIAEIGFNAAVEAVSEGITEREIAAAAEAAMRKAGSEGTGIDTIVASGKNSIPILARTTFRKVEKDDLVLITVAPRYEGYHGAIGRPVIVGKPDMCIRKAVEAAVKAQQACYNRLETGIKGSIVEGVGRKIMDDAGLGKYFMYSGIHSIGVIEFEPPIFGPTSESYIKDNMTISVDIPLFNAPFAGLRVEDGYVMKNGKPQRLNNTQYIIQK